jgi:hypothetical protein
LTATDREPPKTLKTPKPELQRLIDYENDYDYDYDNDYDNDLGSSRLAIAGISPPFP